jgi:hypothetical protein
MRRRIWRYRQEKLTARCGRDDQVEDPPWLCAELGYAEAQVLSEPFAAVQYGFRDKDPRKDPSSVTVTVTGAEAFTDAAGTQPFPSGSSLPPGGQLWLRSAVAGEAVSDVGSLPVARVFDPVTVFDDSSIDTPSLVLDEPGCYSFGASVDPLVGDSAGFPPGAEAETLRVLPKVIPPPFTVTTHASSSVTTAGTRIFDLVTVSGLGLLPGRSIIVTSTVYGPLPPGSDGTCSGIGWEAADLPIAARLAPFRVDGNGQAARSRWVMVWARRKKSSWFDPLPVTPRHRTPPVDRVPLT